MLDSSREECYRRFFVWFASGKEKRSNGRFYPVWVGTRSFDKYYKKVIVCKLRKNAITS